MKKQLYLVAALLLPFTLSFYPVALHAQAPVMVTDFIASGSGPQGELVVFQNAIYFAANDSVHGTELWKFDGTDTSLVADIFPGSTGSNPTYFTVHNGALYFKADNPGGSFPSAIWKFDGVDVIKISDQNVYNLIPFNGALYFADATDYSLYRWDDPTFTLVTDTVAIYSSEMIVSNGVLYFAGTDATHGSELWKYDGVTPSLVADLEPGSAGSNPRYFGVYNSDLYFSANQSFYVTNSVTAYMVLSNVTPSELTVFNNELYFDADFNSLGNELWKWDGTDTALVADINPTSYSAPYGMAAFSSGLYFQADDGIHDFEVYRFDGDTVSLAADINPGSSGSYPEGFVGFNGAVYFTATDGINGYELWKFECAAADISVTKTGDTLTASQSGAAYRWLDCGNGYAVVPSQTAQTFLPTVSGDYAVEISIGSCTDTSACVSVTVAPVGIAENMQENTLAFYPNPARHSITIESVAMIPGIRIVDVYGKLAYAQDVHARKITLNTSLLSNGMYILQMVDAAGVVRQNFRMVVHQ